ncbi:hypothetical protein NEFER03_1035 [Nematocida sp. LUAm3]|nr:hypothetical protein NEFER03_1035 [Nematocida sp. LUAm3]KAI5175361.1 hypothetical protein NEFER02_1290 [Nematocida sp. LUAm2]KAI5177682.1 hypothetical protein NEFER01_0906 [Nematocida sp. LUAm1]
MRKLSLNNGNSIDILGLGTYEMAPEKVKDSIDAAMKTGYRLYDTAQVYKNEREVSAGIKATGAKREDIWITTKVSTSSQGYEQAKASVLKSLSDMEQDYLDMVLIHWPGVKNIDHKSPKNKSLRHESYKALLELQSEGKIRNIGVSNFMPSHLSDLFEEFDQKPQLNQIEISPICYPKECIDFCQKNNVVVQSYSTLGRGLLLHDEWISKHPVLKRLQEKKGGISQHILKWAMDKDLCIIPKSITPSRIKENFESQSITLDEEDKEDLDHFPVSHRTCWDPYQIV